MRLEEIDWTVLWREAAGRPRDFPRAGEAETRERWDYMAPRFRRWMDVDDYPALLLEKIRVEPDWSVLDVGCGTGSIALPLARKARQVTALDISGEMLGILRDDAKKESLTNITAVQCSWERALAGKDYGQHDVVVASRSVGGTMDFRGAVEKLDRAARRFVYLTVWGGGERGHHKGVHKLLGRPCPDVPDYVYAFNALYQMGIRANVEHLMCHSRLVYDSVEDAVDSCRRDFGGLNPSDEAKVRGFLKKTLIKLPDGTVEVPDNRPVWTLLWWKKT